MLVAQKNYGAGEEASTYPTGTCHLLGVHGETFPLSIYLLHCVFLQPSAGSVSLHNSASPWVPGLGLPPLQIFSLASTNFSAPATVLAHAPNLHTGCINLAPGEQCLPSPQRGFWCCTAQSTFLPEDLQDNLPTRAILCFTPSLSLSKSCALAPEQGRDLGLAGCKASCHICSVVTEPTPVGPKKGWGAAQTDTVTAHLAFLQDFPPQPSALQRLLFQVCIASLCPPGPSIMCTMLVLWAHLVAFLQ